MKDEAAKYASVLLPLRFSQERGRWETVSGQGQLHLELDSSQDKPGPEHRLAGDLKNPQKMETLEQA